MGGWDYGRVTECMERLGSGGRAWGKWEERMHDEMNGVEKEESVCYFRN